MAYVGKGSYSCEHAVKITYQAIVLTDSFNEKFHPLSKDNFTVLFPLVNQPILEYTLRFLKSSGIETVYLICSKNADSIQDYLSKSVWLDPSSEMQISVIVSHQCVSLGDTLREIDSRGVIRNDFVLVNQGVVSNVDLKPIIEQHRENYKTNKQLLMTEIYARVMPRHRCRCIDQESVLIIDGKSKRILHHREIGNKRKITFPLSIFQENSHLAVRYDLSGSHISICSPQVLSLFSDNFDFQTKDDFTKGILENEEILGNTIHAHIVSNEYACTIANFQSYDAVSKDIIDRWVYPFVPDINILPTTLGYTYLRQNVYLAKDVVLPRSCNLKGKLVIGEGTEIGDGSTISQSVIGKNCVIGNNVTIEDTHIWNNVKIADGCVLKSAIIAHNVHLLEKVQILPGCILSYNVAVGPDVEIGEGTILVDKAPIDEFGERIALPILST
uniref:EIF2B subunit epsilon/gamma LbH domain-containing protein n=1 Tax=Strigamia maritima TaxID=126957 RepID=T1JMJ8_STRMM